MKEIRRIFGSEWVPCTARGITAFKKSIKVSSASLIKLVNWERINI